MAIAETVVLANYNAICRGFDHEAGVMSNRVTWGILFTGGLFAAEAIVTNIVSSENSDAFLSLCGCIAMTLMSLAGLWFSQKTENGVLAAQGQFDYLRGKYDELKGDYGRLGLPRPFGDADNHFRGNDVARTFPVAMKRVWILALAAQSLATAYFEWVIVSN